MRAERAQDIGRWTARDSWYDSPETFQPSKYIWGTLETIRCREREGAHDVKPRKNPFTPNSQFSHAVRPPSDQSSTENKKQTAVPAHLVVSTIPSESLVEFVVIVSGGSPARILAASPAPMTDIFEASIGATTGFTTASKALLRVVSSSTVAASGSNGPCAKSCPFTRSGG